MKQMQVGFSGGCHWCTEAVFQQLKGVNLVKQGWIAAQAANDTFAEAVIVKYDPDIISLEILIEIHLYTHSSSANHKLRHKYPSAVYAINPQELELIQNILHKLAANFEKDLVTQALIFKSFKANIEKYQNYYQKNPDSRFCQLHISPKLQFLMKKFSHALK